ncbi:membrane protein [Streptomyces viridochromogenes]|uniref:Protein YobA n=1 Tax=Streptomyces viridochromogenes TaxID=1938 RepID=A0A0J7ZCW2_STRVR|nr:copper resistance protein CopC [Streptomyces viridochromogenes]KMS73659.1 membrane protein [Streptomyces viridochromogenes]KOG07850.1 membrane protein [Streptomyces viridochromogenes]KOG28392.1 membrane protein [Streptomyces viridochromogenes]
MTQTIAPRVRTGVPPRVRTLVLLLLAATGLLLAGAGPVSAHAALTGSDPRQGAVVDKAPTQVSLTFSEKVALSDDSLRVLDPKGKRIDRGDPANLSGTTYAVKLHSGLPDGTYTVTYQVVSEDSHPVAGAYTFSIGAPSQTTVSVSGQTAGGGIVGALYGFGRYVSYAGFIVMVGGAAFVLACWQRGAGVRALQRLVVSGWLALTAATLGLLLLRGSYTSTGKVGDIFDLELLGQVLQTKTGAALVSRLLLLAAAALFIAVLFGAYDKREDDEKRDLTFGLAIGGTVVAAGLAASWAMSEHASTGLQAGIAMPVDVVHLVAVASWLGGLAALLVALYWAPSDTPLDGSAVRRFSRVAFGSVLALIATGIYQSWRQLGSWSAFTDTRYGQLLLVKIGLVVLLVGIAWISRRWTARLAETVVVQPEMAGTPGRPGKANAAGEANQAAGGETESVEGADKTAEGDEKAAEGDEKAAEGEKEHAAARAGTSTAAGGKKHGDSKGGDSTAGGSQRAAQLARQQAAIDTARQKQQRDADPNRFGLRRSVLAEAGVAVVLLAVTTMLTSTEPGRTEEEARAATSASSADASSAGALTLDMSFDTGGEDGEGVVRIDLDPARVGGNEMHVYVQRPNGRAFDIPEVKVAFTLESQDIGPLPVVPDHISTGHWSASGVQIPMAGEWKIAVTVRTSDIDQTTVSKNAQIG